MKLNLAKNIAIFMDRDGTVTKEVGYITRVEQLELIPGAADAIRRINGSSFKAVMATNQAGAARGYFPESMIEEVHERLKEMLSGERAFLDGIYFCPHHIDGQVDHLRLRCSCRKPEPGLLLQAAKDLNLDLSRSYMVGDKMSDIEVGHRVGAQSVLVLTGYGREEYEQGLPGWTVHPHHVAEDLWQAVEWIIQEHKPLDRGEHGA